MDRSSYGKNSNTKNSDTENRINIIGAGLAGLSAALTLAKEGVRCRLVSVQASERAQSNLAEGGINACMNVMGEDDHIYEHFEDTIRGGCDLADPNMAAGLCIAAPGIISELIGFGVPFHREEGKLVQRSFGGQKKKRTVFAKSSTGKTVTAALIDAVRKYECEGLVERFPHHEFLQLRIAGGRCCGAVAADIYSGEKLFLPGPVIMAVGGMNGMFEGMTTGSTANTGSAAAVLFAQGVRMANLEMVQYHPTTVQIAGKRMLVSEAARGEGGRLFYYEEPFDLRGRVATGDAGGPFDPRGQMTCSDGSERQKVWFMEAKYGERGNLMPRDVVSREMASCGKEIYLDLTGIPARTWDRKLSDLREEILHYLAIDPCTEPVPVAPGIHFFMGGILIDESHRTNLEGLYAAGECACGYHGANRLGGNSLLAAIYGGKVAALTAAKAHSEGNPDADNREDRAFGIRFDLKSSPDPEREEAAARILTGHMPVLTTEAQLLEGLEQIRSFKRAPGSRGAEMTVTETDCRLLLAEAILMSALARKESRGAHSVKDHPERRDEYLRTTTAVCRLSKDAAAERCGTAPAETWKDRMETARSDSGTDRRETAHAGIEIGFMEIPPLREELREKLYGERTEGRI